MKDLTLGRYFPGGSLLHRADPRTKIVLALLLIAVAFLLQSYGALTLLLVLTVALACSAGKTLAHSMKSLKLVLYLAAMSVVANLIFVRGTPVAEYGILRLVSLEGLDSSAKMVLRLFLLASAASLLTFCTTPFALTAGLERLLQPLNLVGVRVSELALMMLIALRFLPLLVEEAEKLIFAQSSRCADFNRGNLLQRARSWLPLFVPLFAGVARRGDAMVTAMEARCYRGSAGRTRVRPLEFSAADLALVALMLVLLAVPIVLEITAVV